VAVDPLQGGAGGKRDRTRDHLVQGDAQRVQIAAGINLAIHAAGLFGRHVGERARHNFWRRGRLRLTLQLGCNPETGEPYVAVVGDPRFQA
jgi:hypothetical protein